MGLRVARSRGPETASRTGKVPSAEWRRWVRSMKRLGACGLAALMVAGCSGGDSSAPTSVAAVTTSVADTTPATTTPPPSSTTVAATTTLPATTTTVATEELIKQAVEDFLAQYFVCGQAPSQCEPSTFTATQGPSRVTIAQLISGMIDEGLYFSTDLRGSRLAAESVTHTSEDAATAVYCVFDALTVLGRNGPDGLPTIVNDAISSVRYVYSVYREDGNWIVGEQGEVERLGEGDLCPAS
jgi:hypothetical protein